MNKLEGRAKGGKARAEALSPQRRKEIAVKASKERWDYSILRATHGDDKRPLCVGGVEIQCYVLSDGKRVLIQRAMASAIGLGDTSGSSISNWTQGKWISSFLDESIINQINNPIKFKTPQGILANGYDARILADICDSVLAARKAGKLLRSQEEIANQCEILVRGFARVGIIALIDEATGYQEEREKDALSKILEAFIAKELQPWVKTFPIDFYKEIFRLRGLEFKSSNTPSYFGHITNNIVYKRLAPGILEQLKKVTPKSKNGNKTAKYFQSLTLDTGYPKLKEHLGSVVTLMKLSNKYDDFIQLLDRIHPIYPENKIEEIESIDGISDF